MLNKRTMEVVAPRPPYCTGMVQNLCYNPQPDHHERHVDYIQPLGLFSSLMGRPPCTTPSLEVLPAAAATAAGDPAWIALG